MKKAENLTIIMFLTALIPLAAVLTALPLLPDKIPAHYDLNMNIDRFGSKYEMLLFPVLVFLMTGFMYGMSRFQAKQENGGSNRKVLLIFGSLLNLFFTGMTVYFLFMAYNATDGSTSADGSISVNGDKFMQFTFIFLGIVIAIVGNFLPKCKMNAVVGLRTKWSMANEDVWFKCQRFGGVVTVLYGISTAAAGAAFSSPALVIGIELILATVYLIAAITGSKVIHDKSVNAPKD